MKMTQTDYNALETAINKYLADNPNHTLETARELGWNEVNYRWELYHAVNTPKDNFPFRHFYAYLNDNNIDTALRRIVRDM